MILKKVIIISSTFSKNKRGGVASYIDNRALYLSKKVEVIVYGLGKSYKQDNVDYKSIGDPSRFRYTFLINWMQLIIFCLKQRGAIIEIHNIPVALPIFFLFRNRYFFHGPARLEAKAEKRSKAQQNICYFLEKVSLKLSNKIFVISDNFKDVLKSEHPYIKTRILKKLPVYKFNKEFFDSKIATTDHLNFIIVRRLVKRTGVIEFVKLFIMMLKTEKIEENSLLTIAGEGPEQDILIKLIATSGFENNIKYLGVISEKKKIDLFKMADFNIVPTLKLEGFGLVIIEAGICGCKSIVTNVGAMPEVIKYLSNQGILFDLNESSCVKTFSTLKKNIYCKEELHKLTKEKFYFN
jgi:glycosyltransferase involved in cell wall biosynthesis